MSYRIMEEEQKWRRKGSGKTGRWSNLVVGVTCRKGKHLFNLG
jgi:hypothetical protein